MLGQNVQNGLRLVAGNHIVHTRKYNIANRRQSDDGNVGPNLSNLPHYLRKRHVLNIKMHHNRIDVREAYEKLHSRGTPISGDDIVLGSFEDQLTSRKSLRLFNLKH